MQSANDVLSQYTGTDTYYRYTMGMLLTDGVKALAEEFGCYWLLEIIVSYQPELKGRDFQVWRLEVNEDALAVVSCTDGNNKLLKRQTISFTDFSAQEVTIWVEDNVLLLPSEH